MSKKPTPDEDSSTFENPVLPATPEEKLAAREERDAQIEGADREKIDSILTSEAFAKDQLTKLISISTP
jgi:hypothetical protein